MERLQRTEVGGIPVWWAPAPGPLEAGLAFRVGIADEPLAQRGVSHLVEHLALFRLGRTPYLYNAMTADNHTIFDVKGERDEVIAHLHAVADGLRDPPLDRFDDEVNVLRVEGLNRSNSYSTHLRQLRYGARGYGMRGKQELGLRSITPEKLQAWSAAHFTRENAVLWMTGEPPADLDLGLPSGERRPMPTDEPIPRLALPAYVREEDPTVAVTFVAGEPDAEALRITAAIARQRLYDRLRRDCAIVYDVDQDHGVVGPGRLHASLSIDSREEDAATVLEAMLETLGELGEAGPTRDELAFQADQTRRHLEDPSTLEGRLADAALDELNGIRPLVDGDLLAAAEGLTPERCAAALTEALRSAIVIAPQALDTATPQGLTDYEVGRLDGAPPQGPSFRELDETECARRPCTIVVGDEQLHWRSGDGERELRIAFDEVAAVVREAGDSHIVITLDNESFDFSPLAFHDGDALRDAVVAAVGEDRVVPLDAPGRRVEELGARQLSRLPMLVEELYRLSRDLAEDEEVLQLAEAEDHDGPGLLAITDRRMIWHYVSRGAEGDEDGFNETPRDALSDVRAEVRDDGGVLLFRLGDDEEHTELDRITPPEAAAALAEALGGTVTAPPPPPERPQGGRRVRELVRLRQRDRG